MIFSSFTSNLRFVRQPIVMALCLTGLWGGAGITATQVIANWDVVPFQRIDQPFKAGVVAFHETGVDVEFSINGIPAGTVTDPAWNDRTGVFEYWIEVDPFLYADGPITLSATANPEGSGHQSRVLPDLVLYANSGHTLGSSRIKWVDAALGSDSLGDGSEGNPYRTIRKAVLEVGDGGTVYLKKGTGYKLSGIGGGAFTYWTTVSAAPGLSADDVHVAGYLGDGSSTGRYNKSGLRWHRLSMYCDRNPGWGTIFYLESGHRTWMDRVVLYDKNGHLANSSPVNGPSPYYTDCLIRDLTNVGGSFHRNSRIETIGADIFRGSNNLTAINVHIRLMNRGHTDAHPDFIQFYNPGKTVENIVLYNVSAYDMLAQGIFGAQGDVKDVAFVNLLLEKDPPDSALISQVSGSMDHVLLWNTTLVDQTFLFRDTTGLRNWDVRNCVFARVSAGSATSLPNQSNIGFVHTGTLTWQQNTPMGSQASFGDPLYVNVAQDDYRLQPGSPAAGTGTPLPGVPADLNGWRYHASHPNRGAFAALNPGEAPVSAAAVEVKGISIAEHAVPGKARVSTAFRGLPRQTYRVQWSEDLVNWHEIGRRITDSEGRLEVNEVLPAPVRQRFFRFYRQ